MKHCIELEKNKGTLGEINSNNYFYFYYNYFSNYKNVNYKIKTDFGVICDKVGSGKSFVILGLILYKKMLENCEIFPGISTNSDSLNITIKNNNYLPVNILFVPHTIYHQWVEYISKYTNLNFFGIKTKKDIVDDVNFYTKFDLIIGYKVKTSCSSTIIFFICIVKSYI